MCPLCRLVVIALWLLIRAASMPAQTPADPSGRWEGSINVPNMEMRIEIDLAKNAKGELAGTFGQPAQGIKGFPLSIVAIDGRTIRFVDVPSVGASFVGVVNAAASELAGTWTQGPSTLPLTFRRTKN